MSPEVLVPLARSSNSTAVLLSSPNTTNSKAISGGYEILSANLTNGCLDVVGASTASGANIEQNTCIGSANQILS